ncbi:LysR family transcriptional regulator, partial [Escherichia sp. HC-TM1]
MHITLRQLEVFAEVLKSGSTTQASVMLALSQSAVSAALTDLEGQLGVQLFDRVGKRLVVNEHGRLLYPRALALLEQAVEIEQLFREDNGAIRIYASSTIGNYILPAVIARYRHDYPQLPIELSVGNSQDVMQAVLDFRVDIGFIEGPCHSTEIISEPWLEDELVVFAAPTSPLARGPVRSILSRPDTLHCSYEEFCETWPQLAAGGLYPKFGHYCLMPLAAEGHIFG